MSRARATALTLVNWKGVFFERYLLDRHVTALEGANGAGKTTVMIAAYVVLLPDLARLKFTNLGETGATGGDRGIYGRLGDPGASYAALEVELEGDEGASERVLLGVELERKAPPTLSLTPFVVSGLPPELELDALFLERVGIEEAVRTLREIGDAAKGAGAAIDVFDSAKEYFAHLFERGISPLRLSLDEERNKFNDMLRTSMTGGISRTLTSDLRSFLFKQQTGLFDTLTRMKKSLDACRRTRLEVSEARVLEHEINGVYTAGHAMFEAVLEAAKGEALEHRQALERARERLSLERAQVDELSTRVREVEAKREGLGPRLERAQKLEAELRERVARMTRALGAAERLQSFDVERAALLPAVEAAERAQADARAAREQAKLRREAAQKTQARAAAGLASLQAGLEELHRQAHAHRRLRARLEAALAALAALADDAERAGVPSASELEALGVLAQRIAATLGEGPRDDAERGTATRDDAEGETATRVGDGDDRDGTLTPERCAAARRKLEALLAALDRHRVEREREAEVATRRQADRAAALAALALLAGETAPPGDAAPGDVTATGDAAPHGAATATGDAGARARAELARLNELELLGARQAELGREWQRLRALAERQRALGEALAALGFDPPPTSSELLRAVAELDAELYRASEAQRAHEAQAERLAEREASSREALARLQTHAEAYGRLSALTTRLLASGLGLPATRADLGAALRASHAASAALSAAAEEQSAQRERALERARRLEASGGDVPDELVRLAERVGGELLASRYEELELDEARRVHAELGPLAHAIVVDDLERALAELQSEPGLPRDVWLLAAGAEPTRAASRLVSLTALPGAATPPRGAAASAEAVVVELTDGARLSRLPEETTLGRAARQRQAEQARRDAEAAAAASAELEGRRRQQDAVTRDLESLQEHWETWAEGDPRDAIARLEGELRAFAAERERALASSREARILVARLSAQKSALSAELAEHPLLDMPDQAELAERARDAYERAQHAQAELQRCAQARKTLIQLVHELDEAAPRAELSTWPLERAALAAQRDRVFAVAEALAQVEAEPAALGWAHAERALAERTELVPELDRTHADALLELEAAERALAEAEAEWERATREQQSASAKLAALDAHRERARAELDALGLEPPSAEASAALAHAVDEQQRTLEQLAREHATSDAELALATERLGAAELRREEAERAARRAEFESEPSEATLSALRDAARAAGVLELDPSARTTAATPSVQRWLEADAKRELLCDRLAAARGGAELARALRAPTPSDGAPRFAPYLSAWLEVRDWLLRRLPAPIAELGDPLGGLGRLRDDLRELEQRLERQESELRGTSADVARSIDVQLRRASAQVKRLNQALDGVRFGSIHGIRVQLDRIEKMEQVLRALREGETQELLFQSNLPLEEALDEIFRRHAGGRSGGQKLIDYREYLELSVRIQRRGSDGWERVNPSQVSTGEAIGVGAALMMVILSEWERDDSLLRAKKSFGSLRFLFLDEANRLSQDNLGVLFDLCEVLDLQLLIAAPEVARAQGNTTYRLVRRITEDGREEVLVTGRRATLPEAPRAPADRALGTVTNGAPEEPPTPPEPRAPEQLGLL